jgi:hypothetical protein
MEQKDIDVILNRVSELESDRSRYDGVFSECAKYSWPAVQDMVRTVNDEATGADVRTVDIYDSTPRMASKKMATGIFTNLYPVGVGWFEIKPARYEDNENPDLVRQFANVSEIIRNKIENSNFQTKQIAKIRSKIVFGTGSISVKLSKEKKLIFETYHINNFLFDLDCDGIPDTVFRKLYLSARQARQKFPKANLGIKIEEELKTNQNQSKRFEILHCVFPRTDYDPKKKLSKKSKKFVSLYIARDDKHLIQEENGYKEQPYIIGRLDEIPDEVMGVGITAEMLPDIKMTSSMCETFIVGSERASNPTLMAEDDGVVGQPNVSPGAMMYVRNGAKYPEALQTGFNPQLNSEIIRGYKQDIRDGYSINAFDALQDHRNMTAEEVIQRSKDSLTLLSFFVGSEQQDCDLLINRIFTLLYESGEIPKIISTSGGEVEYNIAYNSRLSMTMASVQSSATEQFLAKWAPYNELKPVLDNFDMDVAARMSAFAQGVSARIVRPQSDVEEERQARAQQQQQMAGAELAATAAKAYKDASVPAQENSLAQALAGGM